jgi:DNA processing protein
MIAGLLRAELGPIEALVLVINDSDAVSIVKQLSNDQSPHLTKTLSECLETWRRRVKQADVFRSLEILRSIGGTLVTPQSSNWPEQLNDLQHGAPAALWLLGDGKHLLELSESVAVVGSRVVSEYGKAVTKDVVGTLVREGKPIVSGGAIGIDALAHQRTIELNGLTVAVMAGGIDRLYPAQNLNLFKQIAKTGLIISEVAPGVSPTKWRFLQRNRLIAALSQATVVIEAGFRSGTINTAGHANELGRPVGAVPGPINSVRSAGCHQLIKDGRAQLISVPSDLKDLCGESDYFEKDFTSLGHWELRALDSLGDQERSIAEISRVSGLTSFEAKTGLNRLAKLGLATPTSNGWMKR